jgi:hypothetical protein
VMGMWGRKREVKRDSCAEAGIVNWELETENWRVWRAHVPK